MVGLTGKDGRIDKWMAVWIYKNRWMDRKKRMMVGWI